MLLPQAEAKFRKLVISEELEIFFGLLLLTGLMEKKDRLESYCLKDSLIATSFSTSSYFSSYIFMIMKTCQQIALTNL